MNKILITVLAVVLLAQNNYGQDSLDIKLPYEHSVKKALIWSSIIPGSGQIYNEIGYRRVSNKKNRAWWKVPLIYGGLGATGYYYYINNKQSNLLKEEILYRRDYGASTNLHSQFMDFETEDDLINGYVDSTGATKIGFDSYSKNRDLFVFAFVGIWGLQAIEALVDAHFVSFDISQDLSLKWSPTLLNYKTPGISLSLNIN